MIKKLLTGLLKEPVEEMTNKEIIRLVNTLLESTNNEMVISAITKDNKPTLIDLDEVLYIKNPKIGTYIISTSISEEEYYAALELNEYVLSKSLDFRPMDNGLIVHTSKIIKYDSFYRKVFFTDDRFVVVTGAAIDKIVRKQFPDKSYDMASNKKGNKFEYHPYH